MEEMSIENQLWTWLEIIPGWDAINTPYVKIDSPSVGMIPGALALAIGDQKIYFATGEVTPSSDENGFARFSVEASVIAENGIYELRAIVGEGHVASKPRISWLPLSTVTSIELTTDKNWWKEDYSYFQLSVELKTENAVTIKLTSGANRTATREALMETVRLLQGAGVARS